MADEQQGVGMYGYETDEVTGSSFVFGLNAGKTFLKKFEWTPTGGKDGAEQEALDIIFNIDGTDKSHRMFPITKAFSKDGKTEITDPTATEFKEAVKNLNASIYHIIHAFVNEATYKATMAKPGGFTGFKDFVTTAGSMLPKDFDKVALDIFLQWQWQPGAGKDRTYLEIPKKQSYGKWLIKAQAGIWVEKRADNITENTKEALWYENEKSEKHPFVKNGWFMTSNFAAQLKPSGAQSNRSSVSNVPSNLGTGTPPISGAASVTNQNATDPNKKAATW